jgi:lipoate-protein ligase A
MTAKKYPPAIWRLVTTSPACGAWNMAIDEVILRSIGREEALPTLRLYAWQPPCLSLGYAQPFNDVDITSLTDYGWDLVRRPTGGRAILHTDELTYAVIAPENEPRLAGGVLESYQRLSEAILLALRVLGIEAQARVKPSPAPTQPSVLTEETNQNPVCFEVPSNYEITVNGKKLVGSAQARKKEGVLQHGSLLLGGDLSRISRVLAFKDEQARASAATRLLDRATTAETILKRKVTWEEAALAIVEGFKGKLNIKFKQSNLSSNELALADELLHSKYAAPLWTKRI